MSWPKFTKRAMALTSSQKKTVLLATGHFFQLLWEELEPPDCSAVAELDLLSTAGCLELSHRLCFNDCMPSEAAWALRRLLCSWLRCQCLGVKAGGCCKGCYHTKGCHGCSQR